MGHLAGGRGSSLSPLGDARWPEPCQLAPLLSDRIAFRQSSFQAQVAASQAWGDDWLDGGAASSRFAAQRQETRGNSCLAPPIDEPFIAARSLSLHEQSKIQDPELANHHLRLPQAAGIVSGLCNQTGPRKMDFWNTIKVTGGIGGDNSRNLLKKTKTALIESGFAIIDKIGCKGKSFMGTSKNSSSARADQRDPLQQLEWMGPKATPGPIFRGALIHAKIDSLARAAKRLFSVSMNGVIDAQISKASLKWNSSNHG